ncbi:hypothetical protein ABIA71_002173 [Stenotrophomonas sp. 2619]
MDGFTACPGGGCLARSRDGNGNAARRPSARSHAWRGSTPSKKATRPEAGASNTTAPRYPDLRRNSIPDTTSITIGGSA